MVSSDLPIEDSLHNSLIPIHSEMSVKNVSLAMFWELQTVLLPLQPHFEHINSWLHRGWASENTMMQCFRKPVRKISPMLYAQEWDKGTAFHLKVTGAMPRAWLRRRRPSRTYLFSNNIFPVVVQYWFHFQAFFKGGFIQTVIQTNVDWR